MNNHIKADYQNWIYIDGLRATLINASHFGLTTDFLVLTGISILFLSIGSYLFSKIQV